MKSPSSTLIVAFAVLVSAGCGQPPDAVFVPNRGKVDGLLPEARDMVAAALVENFGTPNKLVAWEKFPIDFGAGDKDLPEKDPRYDDGWRLVEGRHLYMTHCMHCHGVSGDGDGPTSRFLSPRPRDYRQGTFKFKSTRFGVKPTRDDLVHTLEHGIPGTYMPSFVLLGKERLGLLVDYVRWLSIRGSVEISLADALAASGATERDVARALENDDTKKLKRADAVEQAMKAVRDDVPEMVETAAGDVNDFWQAAQEPDNVVVPKVKRTLPTKDSIGRGRLLFLSQYPDPKNPDPKKKTKCAECHGESGRGDGPNTEEFWKIPDVKPERKYEVAGLHDNWGHPQKPRDLTRGLYRGGRRPLDIFRRVHEGIPGTQMPGFGSALSQEEIWDIVNYVLSIPFDGEYSAGPSDLIEAKEQKKEVATAED